MDRATSVTAALQAGKLPTQKQISQHIDWLLQSGLVQVEPTDTENELSAQGKILAGDAREILSAYKQLGSNKNADNILQEALWHLSVSDLKNTSVDVPMDVDHSEASKDIDAVRTALRTLVQIVWTNASSEGYSMGHDFASFARLALADAAEAVEVQAAHAKKNLRQVDDEVQRGERDAIGRKRKADGEEDPDVKVKWEKGMDTVKDAGSTAIGAGQAATAKASETYDKTSTRIWESYYQVCDRAQKDDEYKQSLQTLFDVIEKWLTRTLDTATNTVSQASLDDFINDPTPEQHIPKAIRALTSFAECFAGGKSLDDLFSRLKACVVDVREDPDLKTWFGQFFAHVRRSLEEPAYARSEEAKRNYGELRSGWKGLLKKDSEKGKKWKEDVAALRHELSAYEALIDKDKDLQRLRRAHVKLSQDLQDSAIVAAGAGIQFALDQASWFWQDAFRVYVPRIMAFIKDIPIPRTEYTDSEVEFVLEDLDISSFNLLPGHIYIRNITDVDITAPAASTSPSHTAVGTLTHIRAQALQLTLRDVSFYYKDKTAAVGPSEYTGILEFRLPPQGIDVDVKVRMLPNTPDGLKQRERRKGFHEIEHVEVKVAEDIEVDVKQSNHALLLAVFKPVLAMRFRDALEKTLTAQLRASLEALDGVAWDVAQRSVVFTDMGLGAGPALVAASWSEAGKLSRGQGGLLSGWRATGTGLVKEDAGDEGVKIAIGAEPQILGGEKRGPKGTFAEPIAERLDAQGGSVQDAAGRAAAHAEGVKESAKEALKVGTQRVQTFRQSVKVKVEEEKRRDGWKSPAFDISS